MASPPKRSIHRSSRVGSLQQEDLPQRHGSYTRRRGVTAQDAYTHALRVAFLSYLLQPRQKKLQHVTAPRQVQRASSSVTDMVKDFSLIRDSKSTKFPHGFMGELDKRITGVLIGKERRPEFNDPVVKRTFAVFLNEFKAPQFRKSMEKDRRVEDLLLIFFSNATKELGRGKAHDDDSWKLTVDRHVALFIRLVSSTLKDNDWARDRPELATRLQTMEKKLLVHDQDLASNGAGSSSTIEVEVPRSYDVKDMPLAQVVTKIFGMSRDQVQTDINNNKTVWTEKAALQDLKLYQTNLSLHTKSTLSIDDFDSEEAYDTWKKAEIPDLTQMMLAIVQSNPELAKSTPGGALPQFNPGAAAAESGYADLSRNMSNQSDEVSSYVIDQPVDMSGLNLRDDGAKDGDTSYTFIPPDPRQYYRAVLKEALTFDLFDNDLQPSEATEEVPSIKLLSKTSAELLNEIALRWRIPQFSRMVLFLDVIKDKYQHQEIDLETLDAAFNYVKEPPIENKKGSRTSQTVHASLFDRSKWTVTDYALNTRILTTLHDALLRDLFELVLECYGSKAPPLSPVMFILTEHIYDDPLFSKPPEELDEYTDQLAEALRNKVNEVYQDMFRKEIPQNKDTWEFYNVIQLGKSVVKIFERTKKRYRKQPEIMGVNPLRTYVEAVLPIFAQDARDLVESIMEDVANQGQEIPVQDGFDLYREMTELRRLYSETLPGQPFAFHIENHLQEFVWRWIEMSEQNLVTWVEGAVKEDNFQVRVAHPDNIPTDDERHSLSVMDVFRSFNQTIDQIIQLNWDDDLQYAKFMTTLAKSISQGVARYCELVEGIFSREMDRLTPEQEAAARQTRQEKWMQLAKDTWQQKEKIEPFQFLPESLVKLNNIEFSMHELDKLEKEINVDACAEVIQRNTPTPVHRQKRDNKYVFTIKIIEAEDLKACDMNGLSDPYVVLGDEYQKRLAKTRVIYGNLNPRWDETVDITTQGPLNIIATIWDWDALGDHDCAGRTSLKLDPSHFRDFMPREYWLDLDTQGRLLLRVSMEGERDDIQFYFGKSFRTLKRTERDMTRKITDKLSSYIHQTLSRRSLRAMLSTGITISSVSSFLQRGRPPSVSQPPTQMEVANALKPLFTYFNDNFAIMKETLTDAAMIMVMTRLWKEVLVTIEGLLVPPLSDKLSQQRPLSQQELDVVFKWLQMLFDFFNAVDEETGISAGVPIEVLKSPKYHELQNLNFFYFETTENLIRTSEAMASATAARQQAEQQRQSRLAASNTGHQFGGAAGLLGLPVRRTKTIMLSRNLGTMKKAKEEKRKEAQADPNDDIILRILRMRPEAERYLKDRSRQKERLAAAAAAEMIVRQSLNSGGGRMAAQR